MTLANGNGIDWLTQRLPRPQLVPIPKEPDHYGASYLVARELGWRAPARSRARWQHGWWYTPPVHAAELVGEDGRDYVFLVATDEMVRFLQQHGFRNAFAVGLPFVYANYVDVERRPKSLLVMPPHSYAETEHGWDEDAYAREIAALRPHFSSIVACISASCVEKGYWTGAFARHDIPWIVGAAPADRNALVRMHTILKSFEYMTTNTIGSHVAYAAYCGCKVSIYGTYANLREADYRSCPFYQRYPEILNVVVAGAHESSIRSLYPELFVAPHDAVARPAWGAAMVGADHRRSAHVLAALLGWPPPLRTLAYEYVRNLPPARTYKRLLNRFRQRRLSLPVPVSTSPAIASASRLRRPQPERPD
jgi:hypothetical protein